MNPTNDQETPIDSQGSTPTPPEADAAVDTTQEQAPVVTLEPIKVTEPATEVQDEATPSEEETSAATEPTPFVAPAVTPAAALSQQPAVPQPRENLQKSKKPLLIAVVVGVALLLLGGLAFAAATILIDPEKRAQNALINTVELQSAKYRATVDYKSDDESYAGKIEGKFDREAQFATLDFSGPLGDGETSIELTGGVIAHEQDVYVKVGGLDKLVGLYQLSAGFNIYDQLPGSADFVKDYDDRYIRIAEEDITELSTKIPALALAGDLLPSGEEQSLVYLSPEDTAKITDKIKGKTFFQNIEKVGSKQIFDEELDGYSVELDDAELEVFFNEVMALDIEALEMLKSLSTGEDTKIDSSSFFEQADLIVYLDGKYIGGAEIIPTAESLAESGVEAFTLLVELTDYNEPVEPAAPEQFKTIVEMLDALNALYGGQLYTQINSYIGLFTGAGFQSDFQTSPSLQLEEQLESQDFQSL